MGDELTIRRLDESDRPRALDLLERTMGGGSVPRTQGYWSWKHERNPFGRSVALIAEYDGTMVGLRIFMRWIWDMGGEQICSVRAVDTATHPNWQGRGIFSRLTSELVDQVRSEGVAFVFNTPNRFSRPGYLKMGWTSLGRVSLWVRPRFGAVIAPWRKASAKPWKAPNLPGEESSSVAELLTSEMMDRMEGPPQSIGRSLRTSIGRHYLRWRYAEIPGFRYEAIWDDGNEGAAGLIFRLVQRGNRQELRICQILQGPGGKSSALAGALLRDALRQTKADYAVSMSTNDRDGSALARAGFLPAPRTGPIFTVRPLNELAEALNVRRRSTWRPCIGDLELF